MRFKEFLHGHMNEKAHNFLHHLAEEELIACKVIGVELEKHNVVRFIVECLDKPRKEGYQKDLSDKITERLKVQKIPGIGTVSAKVYHQPGVWGTIGD